MLAAIERIAFTSDFGAIFWSSLKCRWVSTSLSFRHSPAGFLADVAAPFLLFFGHDSGCIVWIGIATISEIGQIPSLFSPTGNPDSLAIIEYSVRHLFKDHDD